MQAWLDQIKNLKLPPLKPGMHKSPEAGLCAMEMVAFMERLPHSDAPPCTCPVIAAFVREVNDHLTDTGRQRLLPILPQLVGTVSEAHANERAQYLATETVQRYIVPLVAEKDPAAAAMLMVTRDVAIAYDIMNVALFSEHTVFTVIEPPARRAMRHALQACLKTGLGAPMEILVNATAHCAEVGVIKLAAVRETEFGAPFLGALTHPTRHRAELEFEINMLAMLEGVLKIGPTSPGFSSPERVRDLASIAEAAVA